MVLSRIPFSWGSQLALHCLLWSSALGARAVFAEVAVPETNGSGLSLQAVQPSPDAHTLTATLGTPPVVTASRSIDEQGHDVVSVSEFKDGLTQAAASELASTVPVTAIAQAQLSSDQSLPIPTEPGTSSASGMKRVLPVSQLSSEPSEQTVVANDKTGDRGQISQVTSVSQLSDVQPTDWAFQALQSLVERYGCIAGYPNKTYRGNRPLSRYEFAAGLNACMDRVNELIASATADAVKKEDLVAIQKLQEEFAAELATLKGRVDSLEARTKTLEAQQFSTTTKLSALAWFNLTGAFADKKVKVETVDPAGLFGRLELRQPGRDPITKQPIVSKVGNPQVTFSNLVWLTLNTSFTGKDQLVTQLAAGNGESPANVFASSGLFNTFGTPYTDQTAGVQGTGNQVIIRELFYSFPATKKVRIVAGPSVNWYRYFDNNAFTFFLTGPGSFNSIGSALTNTIDRGAGAVVLWDITNKLKFHVGYLGENDEFLPGGLFKTSTDPRKGLFGGTWTATAELTYSPTKKMNFRFLYNRSQIQALNGLIGGVTGEPLQGGIADAGPGLGLDVNPADGGLKDSQANTFGLSFDWLITPKFGIFGRYGYAITHLQPIKKDITVQSFQAGFALPDLGKKGALGSLSFLVPFDVLSGKKYLVSGVGDGGTQYELEATYFLPLTQNIAIVPAIYTIINPNNFDSNPAIFVGNFRTQFSF